jgi:glycosyltransferase involved in cell wall biosynthesis
MRIVFFTHYFTPEGNAPAVRVHELGRRWVAAGHELVVVTGVPNVPDGVVYQGYRNRLRQRDIVDGIQVLRVWTYLAANRGTVCRVLNYLSFMVSSVLGVIGLRRPDIVVATSPQFFCAWAGRIAAAVWRVPFVLDVRDLWPESISAVGAIRNAYILRILEWMEKKLYAWSRCIVTVGEGYRARLVERGVPPDSITVIPNGVDAAFASCLSSDAVRRVRRTYGLDKAFVCAYIGTIGMACGLDIVLEAARRLRRAGRTDIRFLLVGDGATRATLQQQAEREQLDAVIFAGRRPREEVPAFLAVADACLVHLRKAEPFRSVLPSKLFEAAAMERPIILGVEGAAADWLRTAGAGFTIEPENAIQLVATIDRLIGEPGLGREAGRRGRAYVEANHDRATLAERYLELLDAVQKSGQRQRGYL